jgi:2-methylcitrate dehydratase PrpD
VEVVDPLGDPENPMQDHDIEEKFSAMVEPVLGAQRCRQALDGCWRAREADGVASVFQLLDL